MATTDVDLTALRSQARSLAELLRTELPKYVRTHRALRLEETAPAAIAALWESVGWSEVFERCGLASPELASSEARIAARLEEYRSWGEGFTLTAEDLPSPRRLVADDGQGVGFLITDERGATNDATIVSVLAAENHVKREASSYVAWCANEMVKALFARWYEVDVKIQPAAALTKLGHCPWPSLTQAARCLSSDVYCVPQLDSAAASPHRNGKYRLAYRSPQALVAFLETIEIDSIDFEGAPSDHVRSPSPAERLLREDDRVRWLPTVDQKKLCVGTIAGEPMILIEEAGATRVYVNPRALARLKPIIDERKA